MDKRRFARVVVLLSLIAGQSLVIGSITPASSDDGILASPSARCCMGFSFFPAPVRKIILYGGLDSTGTVLSDTWSFNGSSWQLLTPATNPGPRSSTRMIYDAQLGKIVLFGGKACMTCAPVDNETWLFDGTNWTKCTCSLSRPGKRTSPGLAFDSVNQVVALFGGSGSGGGEPFDPPLAPLGDTWTFDGSNWTQCATQCQPGSIPQARSGPEMAYDALTGETVMFGGQSGFGSLGDTWFFHPTQTPAWSQCTDSIRCPADKPGPRSGHRMAYDTVNHQVLLFGAGNPALKNDTWLWTGNPGNWVQCGPTNGCTTTPPAKRCCVGLAFDGARGKISLFGGGFSLVPNAYGDMWTWTATSSWQCISPVCNT